MKMRVCDFRRNMESSDFMALKIVDAIGERCHKNMFPYDCANCIFLKETESRSFCRLTENVLDKEAENGDRD